MENYEVVSCKYKYVIVVGCISNRKVLAGIRKIYVPGNPMFTDSDHEKYGVFLFKRLIIFHFNRYLMELESVAPLGLWLGYDDPAEIRCHLEMAF